MDERCPPHHWLIDTPQGPTSAGRCLKCGEVREFANGTADPSWLRDGTEDRLSGLPLESRLSRRRYLGIFE